MGEYHGPDRRGASIETMVARIDERVLAMTESMAKLATVERVETLERGLTAHTENHKWGMGTILGGGGLIASIIALIQTKGHP